MFLQLQSWLWAVILSHGEVKASVKDLLQWRSFLTTLQLALLLVMAHFKLKTAFALTAITSANLILRFPTQLSNTGTWSSFIYKSNCEQILWNVHACFIQRCKSIQKTEAQAAIFISILIKGYFCCILQPLLVFSFLTHRCCTIKENQLPINAILLVVQLNILFTYQ